MGKASRDKGARFERAVVNWHRERSIDAERVPLSGAAKGSFAGDLIIHGMTAECKCRARGFQLLYDALAQDDAELLFVKQDRAETLVVLPLETYERFLEWAGIKS